MKTTLLGGMPILLKDNQDGTYTLVVSTDIGGITIGAVEIKDPITGDKIRVNADGSINVKSLKVLDEYSDSDIDVGGDVNYYGFLKKNGNWYILKETISSNMVSYRYAKGDSNYTTNWNNRASLVYDYFNVVFGG